MLLMKRYLLPSKATPGEIPSAILHHRDALLTSTYIAFHAIAVLYEDRGPFTSAQIAGRVQKAGAAASVTSTSVEACLASLVELGFIREEYIQ